MDSHVDLVRNDWSRKTRTAVARIYVGEDVHSVMVKDLGVHHYEGNVLDTLGDAVKGTASEIVPLLRSAFHGPYLVVTELHDEARCPFENGDLPIEMSPVEGKFVLPAPAGLRG